MTSQEPLKIEEFRETASNEELRVLDRIMRLAKREERVFRATEKELKDLDNLVDRVRVQFGSSFVQVTDLIKSHEIDPIANLTRNKGRYLMDKVQGEMKDLFIESVSKYGMGNLGFIQRNYENVVGEPMPEQSYNT